MVLIRLRNLIMPFIIRAGFGLNGILKCFIDVNYCIKLYRNKELVGLQSYYALHHKGRIWLEWNVNICTVDVFNKNDQIIQCKVNHLFNNAIFLSVIYGLHNVEDICGTL